MKKTAFLFLCSIIFLMPTVLIAQSKVLSGAIVIGNAEVMSYKIEYEIKSNNTISGYSISDVNGKEETRASITGYYNAKKKILFFEEKTILDTRSKTPSDEFCLMKVTGTFETKGANQVYVGKFEAKSPNPAIECDSGTIMLMTEKTLDKLAAKANKVAKQVSKTDSLKNSSKNLAPIEWVKNEAEISSGDSKTYQLVSRKIQLELVDDRFQDGDKVTLIMNDATIVRALEVTNQIKSYSFELPEDEKEVTFRIIAENEGSIALTTVKAVIRNGNHVNILNISLNKGQSVKIALKEQ